jgi:hypothetical protein
MPWRCMGERSYSFTILNLGTRWGWVVSFMPQPLYTWGRVPSTHWIAGWVGPCRESNPSHSTPSRPLYLIYPRNNHKYFRFFSGSGATNIISIICLVGVWIVHLEVLKLLFQRPKRRQRIWKCDPTSSLQSRPVRVGVNGKIFKLF